MNCKKKLLQKKLYRSLLFLSLLTILAFTAVLSFGAPAKAKNVTILLTQKSLDAMLSGTIINPNKVKGGVSTCFYASKISKSVKKRITGKSFKEDGKIALTDLRYLRVLYYGFDNKSHIGELIVNKSAAADFLAVFKKLYKEKYPIEKMILVDNYDAEDKASMADNNTSAFNYRTVAGSKTLSKHALGLAIDINPLYNPCVEKEGKKTVVSPVEGKKYADRSLDNPYYIKQNDICYEAFTKLGFTWGGSWNSLKDYQHFQLSK